MYLPQPLVLPNVLDERTTTLLPQALDETETSKLGPVVSNAVITSNGQLTPNFEYIDGLRKSQSEAKRANAKVLDLRN